MRDVMDTCKVCGSENTKFSCLILENNICVDCCNEFQICKLKKWGNLIDEEMDVLKLSEKCLECEGLFRNTDEEFEFNGNHSRFSFYYRDKFIFSNDFRDLFQKKKVKLLKSLKELDIEGTYHLADALYYLGEIEETIKLLEGTMKLIEGAMEDNIFAEMYILLGRAYLNLNNYGKTEFYYKEALKIDDSNASIYREIGTLYEIKEDYFGSIHYYNKSLEKLGVNEEGELNDFFSDSNYLGLAISYSKLKKSSEVIKYAEKFLKQGIGWERLVEFRDSGMKYSNLDFDIYANSTLYHLIAISYLELNNLESAEEYINRAVELDKGNVSFAKLQGIIIGRKYNEGEMSKYQEEIKQLKTFAELRTSSITKLKAFEPEEQVIIFTGNNKASVRDFLIKHIFTALRSVLSLSSHVTPSIDKPADEDKYIDLFREQMKWLNLLMGWTTHTQNRGGFTRKAFAIRGGIGERDIVIKDQFDNDLLIGEALILKGLDTQNIIKHTEKNFGYDIQSANFQIIIIWGFNEKPDELWGKYKDIVNSRAEGYFSVVKFGELEEIIPNIDKKGMRTYYSVHTTDNEEEKSTVVHIYVDIYNHMKRSIAQSAREKK